MKSKSVCIVDYIGNSYNDKPIGHPLKVIEQFYKMLSGKYNSEKCLPNIYKDVFRIDHLLTDYCKIENKNRYIFFKKKVKNLKKIFSLKKDILIFVNTDIVLYLLIPFLKKQQKVVVVNYCDYKNMTGVLGSVKKIIYMINYKFIDLELNTYDIGSDNYIPDYFYEINKNNLEYNNEDTLIIGTMNKAKDLESVITAFKKINSNLRIIGKFYDNKYYEKMLALARGYNNITIINKYLTIKEYEEEMSKCKRVILPYKPEFYKNITSGVFLEALYNEKIVLVPKTSYFNQFYERKLCICYSEIEDIILNENTIIYKKIIRNIQEFNSRNTLEKIREKVITKIESM